MFDALDVDEKNNPNVVASRISEIMSGESIYMLDISEEPPWYSRRRIEDVEPVARAKKTAIQEIVSPINAESFEAESAARTEEIKARNEAGRTATWGNARIEAAETVSRAKEVAIIGTPAEITMARAKMWDSTTEMRERT